MTPLLKVKNMTHFFGGLRAVYNYNLTLEKNRIQGLIGPNGAGKTTVFNLITGIFKPSKGSVKLDNEEIAGLFPYQIASKGLGRTFQNLLLWRHLTVFDHIKIAHYSQISYGLIGSFFGTKKRREEEAKIKENSYRLMEIFDISDFADMLAVNLPYGAQRRVEMARAMAIKPKALFLDEPTAGMTPEELIRMIQIIKNVQKNLTLQYF